MVRSPWRQALRLDPRQGLRAGLMVGALIVVVAIGYSLLKPPVAISGRAEIVDGDTLRIGAARIRLAGLDAPELDQTCTDVAGAQWPCGWQAKGFLVGLVAKRSVTCISSRHDVYGRALARCDAGQGDVGAMIVAAGWAVPDFAYGPEAARSQAARLGIWSSSFIQPLEWRRSHDGATPDLWAWITSWLNG